MRTVEFNARLSSLAVVELKGAQVVRVPLALPHSLEVLAGLAALLGQDVSVMITSLQPTLDDASDRGVTVSTGGLTVQATTFDWLNPATGELQRVQGGTHGE